MLIEIFSDDSPHVQFDHRINRKIHPTTAYNLNSLYSTIFPFMENAKSVLDLGCYLGALGQFLKEAGYSGKYTGVEIQQDLVDTASRFNHDGHFIKADCLELLEKTENKFDVIVCLGVTHCFIEPFSLTNEIIKHTKNTIIIDTKNVYKNSLGFYTEMQHKYEIICTMGNCPTPNWEEDKLLVDGLSCSITPEYMELFMNTKGWQAEKFSDQLISKSTGVYGHNPYVHRALQIYKKGKKKAPAQEPTIQELLK